MDKQAVLDSLKGARTRLSAVVEGLGEPEKTTVPIFEAWTLRELLAHIGGWATWDLEAIGAIQQGKGFDLSVIRDVDRFNTRLIVERGDWSLDQILAELKETQIAMQELVTSLSDQELFNDGSFQGPYWDNLAEWLQIAWEHEDEHIAQIRVWRDSIGL